MESSDQTQSALVSAPRINWWPYHKVWASMGGAIVGCSAAIIGLAHPLAIIARDVLTLSPEGVESAEKVAVVILTLIGTGLAGYFKAEPLR